MKYGCILLMLAGTAGPALGQQWIEFNRRNAICGTGDGLSTCYRINQSAEPSVIVLRDGNSATRCSSTTLVARMTPKTEYVQFDVFSSISLVRPIEIQDGGDCGFIGVFVGPNNFADPDVLPGLMNASWGGLEYNSASSTPPEISLYGGISGNLTGPIRDVDRLIRFDCAGALNASISATEGAIGRGAVITAGSTTSSGNISVSKIESIAITGNFNSTISTNDVSGDITVGGTGGLGRIIITNGSMTGDINVAGELSRVKFTGGVGSMNALNGDLHAKVLGRETPKEGSFTGFVLNGSIFVEEDILDNACSINTDWTGSNRLIRIGRTLHPRNAGGQLLVANRNLLFSDTDTTDGVVTNGIDSDKFVIINAANHTPSSDDNSDGNIDLGDFWLGGVSIDWAGSSNLGPDITQPTVDEVLIGPDRPDPYHSPYYKVLSHEFGGGAIGVAPFNFHQFTGPAPSNRSLLDCNPHHLEVLFVGACEEVTDLDKVTIDHYGPVYVLGEDDDEEDRHFRVEYRPDDIGGPLTSGWNDVSHLFQVDSAETNTASTPGNLKRKIVLEGASGNTPGFASAGRFRIRPEAGKVKCDGLIASPTPDVLWKSSIQATDCDDPTGPVHNWYQFRVRLAPCQSPAVFEGEQVNSWDFTTWLNEPFEVNSDGQTDMNDLLHMTDAYNQ